MSILQNSSQVNGMNVVHEIKWELTLIVVVHALVVVIELVAACCR